MDEVSTSTSYFLPWCFITTGSKSQQEDATESGGYPSKLRTVDGGHPGEVSDYGKRGSWCWWEKRSGRERADFIKTVAEERPQSRISQVLVDQK